MDVEERLASSLADRYTIEKEIGRGGMATVFSAQDMKHGRKVALKVLLPDISESIAGDRFLREIEISARLNHPNIVPLFDSGIEGGILYYVMPLQEGESLRDRIEREGPLPLTDAVQIAAEVAGALAHAHDHGVVHRDIKPDNILFSHGQAVIADFGVARALESSSTASLTASGLAVGTPWYMSPEQAEGRGEIDGRSDLYSLGCVLYETVGGEPPFPGKTPQAVIARRLSEKPLPLSILRESVPKKLDDIIQKSLQRVPGDRFQTAEDFQQALLAPDLLADDPLPEKPSLGRRLGQAILGLSLLAAAGFGIREWVGPPAQVLDPNKVVVFPLGDRGGGGLNGANASLAIIMALEHADPLRPLDAWDRLGPEQRENIDMLSPEGAREIALASGAGHYLTGAVTRRGDSVGVSLALYATGPDSLVARESRPGTLSDLSDDTTAMDEVLSQLGIGTAIGLLPDLIDPGRELDLTALTERDPAAIVQWIHGEREYRLSRFEEALEFYEAAVETDSLLSFAALKGAQAASWIKEPGRAVDLLETTLLHPEALPSRHQNLAKGLLHFSAARPDSAVRYLRAALEEDEGWSEAWMALGEAYYHLFPTDLVVDSSYLSAFRRADSLDPGFHPPLIHLGEDAIRKGRLGDASRYINRLSGGDVASYQLQKLRLMFRCVDQGSDRAGFQERASLDPNMVLDAARHLSVGGYQAECAKTAFRALLSQTDLAPAIAWGAIQGLQGLLVAEGRFHEALALLDSASARSFGEAQLFLIMDVIAGAPWEDRARQIEGMVRERFGAEYSGLRPSSLWLIGAWSAHLRDSAMLDAALGTLERRTAGGDPVLSPFAKALQAEAHLLSGDTARALDLLESALPRAPSVELGWGVSGSLPTRHLTLARVLLEQGRFAEALQAASVFDHPEPVAFLPFLPASLQIRLRAAEALGLFAAADGYRERLQRLGHPVIKPES